MGSVNKVLCLNPPYSQRVQRRYMCSYNAPNMLFPPIELMYLASIAREWHHKEVVLLDAIADRISMAQTLQHIESVKPDLIVTISDFEIFDIYLASISTIK